MEKSKPRGNILSLEVYQGVGYEIIGQQPHHTESHELKQDGPYLGVKPKGYLLWCRAVLKASHLRSKGSFLVQRFDLSVPVRLSLVPLTSYLLINSELKRRVLPVAGAPFKEDYLNGWAYMSPPFVHRLFNPRSSLRGVLGPTLRSKTSA